MDDQREQHLPRQQERTRLVRQSGPSLRRLGLLGMFVLLVAVFGVSPGVRAERTHGSIGPTGSFLSAAAGKAGSSVGIEVRAEQLSYRPADGCSSKMAGSCPVVIELAGGIAIRYGDLRLRATAGRVEIDAKGDPIRAQVSGKVKLALGARVGRAERVSFDLRQRAIELDGGATLHCPDLRLELRGERIALDLQTNRVQVARARLTLDTRGADGR